MRLFKMDISSLAAKFKENFAIRFLFKFYKKHRPFIHQFRWSKLDGYILKSFLLFVFGSLILFVFIFELTQIFQEMRFIPPGSNSLYVFYIYFFGSFYWINVIQPFSFLFGSAFVMNRLAHSKELVAIVSTGTSLFRIN